MNGPGVMDMSQMPQAYPASQDNSIMTGNDFHSALGQNSFAMSFESQMQTPPPTGDSSAKRLVPGQHAAFGTPSTIASRRNVTPQQSFYTQQGVMQHSTPVQFPYLPFSPEECSSFSNMGSATAPAMPQGNLLWAQSSPIGMYPQQNLLSDPFAPAQCESMAWPSMNATAGVQAVAFDTPAMVEFPTMAPHQIPLSMTSVVPSSRPSTMSGAVDPALLFASPTRPIGQQRNHTQVKIANAPVSADVVRRGSATESINGTIVPNHIDMASASARLPSANRPGLRRSNTTPTLSMIQQEQQQVPARTGSPLKRVGLPLTSINETSAAVKKQRQRNSVVLMIDESGRARAESRPISSTGKVDSPTQSARAKYPGLFDSDSEDSDDDADDGASDASSASLAARNASFRPSSKSIAGTHVLPDPRRSSSIVDEDDAASSIPSRSNSSASNRVAPSRAAIAAVAQLRRASSIKRSQSLKRNSVAGSSFAFSTADSSMLFGETYAPFQNTMTSQSHQGTTLEDHNRRWSTLSIGQQQTQRR
jgi:hypothetical protein